ncbi:DUF3293 domain-containing protein [Pseudomarimonas salicorniae]|uniref:DUF3293 domain-containing protein n=1 Tax=Pseudomarimonas salicorniae TaxID=2933270 RepID=A0ABT0GLU8_9GAMM|nr:DUF3293 domain-containing protein [Lysobacter sp. CAU 1642]MCK7595523.1 DUF3293 domain-containing protein [Lysobacter sp. CAU 1642]
MSHPLEAAFRATCYRILLDDDWIETRIDRPSPRLARWLAEHACPIASLVSARNPQGRALDDVGNRERERTLRAELAGRGLIGLPAEGTAGDWREPSLFVPGLGGEACRALMQAFDQLAWVEYDAAGLARLRWTRDPDSQEQTCR